MDSKTAVLLACTLIAGSAMARDVSVAYRVSGKGIDLSQPAGAHELYGRLQHAARIVCTHGNRVDLQASPDPEGCYEKALGEAIRSAKVSLLTQAYLATHTLREAGEYGIEVPLRIAAQ